MDIKTYLTNKQQEISLHGFSVYRLSDKSIDFVAVRVDKPNTCFCKTIRYCQNCQEKVRATKEALVSLEVPTEIVLV